jgi:hypothetical protein
VGRYILLGGQMKSNLKVKEAPQSTPSQKKKYWKKEITDDWQTSVKSIIRVGEILIASKEDLEYGSFSKMIENELPFGCRVAQTLIKLHLTIGLQIRGTPRFFLTHIQLLKN